MHSSETYYTCYWERAQSIYRAIYGCQGYEHQSVTTVNTVDFGGFFI